MEFARSLIRMHLVRDKEGVYYLSTGPPKKAQQALVHKSSFEFVIKKVLTEYKVDPGPKHNSDYKRVHSYVTSTVSTMATALKPNAGKSHQSAKAEDKAAQTAWVEMTGPVGELRQLFMLGQKPAAWQQVKDCMTIEQQVTVLRRSKATAALEGAKPENKNPGKLLMSELMSTFTTAAHKAATMAGMTTPDVTPARVTPQTPGAAATPSPPEDFAAQFMSGLAPEHMAKAPAGRKGAHNSAAGQQTVKDRQAAHAGVPARALAAAAAEDALATQFLSGMAPAPVGKVPGQQKQAHNSDGTTDKVGGVQDTDGDELYVYDDPLEATITAHLHRTEEAKPDGAAEMNTAQPAGNTKGRFGSRKRQMVESDSSDEEEEDPLEAATKPAAPAVHLPQLDLGVSRTGRKRRMMQQSIESLVARVER